MQNAFKINWVVDSFGNKFFEFKEQNIDTIDDELIGIYIIWYKDFKISERVRRVGQGTIKARLKEHIKNPEITKYSFKINILFSYAKIPQNLCNGIERYLGMTLLPKVGERFPDTNPIKVNFPWQ